MTTAIYLIAQEVLRVRASEGYTVDHDRVTNTSTHLRHAGKAYLEKDPDYWPRHWSITGFKPQNVLRDLTRAGALSAMAVSLATMEGDLIEHQASAKQFREVQEELDRALEEAEQ